MSTLQIDLTDDLKDAAEHAVASGRFATVSEYVSTLIRHDQTTCDDPKLEEILKQRIDAGPASPMQDGDFDVIRARLEAHISQRMYWQ